MNTLIVGGFFVLQNDFNGTININFKYDLPTFNVLFIYSTYECACVFKIHLH